MSNFEGLVMGILVVFAIVGWRGMMMMARDIDRLRDRIDELEGRRH